MLRLHSTTPSSLVSYVSSQLVHAMQPARMCVTLMMLISTFIATTNAWILLFRDPDACAGEAYFCPDSISDGACCMDGSFWGSAMGSSTRADDTLTAFTTSKDNPLRSTVMFTCQITGIEEPIVWGAFWGYAGNSKLDCSLADFHSGKDAYVTDGWIYVF